MPTGFYVFTEPTTPRYRPPNRPHRGDRARVKAARRGARTRRR